MIRLKCRDGSLADIMDRVRHVRFTPESGHDPDVARRPLSANSRHENWLGLHSTR